MSTIIDRALAGKFVLIAEIGVNYYDIATKFDISLMDAAKLMIKEAKDAGIHAVKFQSYKAGTLAAKAPHLIGIPRKSQLPPSMNFFRNSTISAKRNTAN